MIKLQSWAMNVNFGLFSPSLHTWYFPDICVTQIELESVERKICSTKYIKRDLKRSLHDSILYHGHRWHLFPALSTGPHPKTTLSSIYWILSKILQCSRYLITSEYPLYTLHHYFPVLYELWTNKSGKVWFWINNVNITHDLLLWKARCFSQWPGSLMAFMLSCQ